ncbi:hypothetical protein TUM4249_38070 [Shewanella sp. KT0246]|nr:hypothetical protein TUM4249_38070 [Shewanella sp. KT0246]
MPLGANGSLQAMLKRSFGAESFYVFWQYWNPIWGFYLSRYVMRPLNTVFPIWFSILLTFAVSGALHDIAVTIIKWQVTFFFTPWFILMGIIVFISKLYNISYRRHSWLIRMLFNLFLIVFSFSLTIIIQRMYA